MTNLRHTPAAGDAAPPRRATPPARRSQARRSDAAETRAPRPTPQRVILIANAKGGGGKTTIATTLASALAAAGERVALADADPQRSSLTWLARRPSDAAAIAPIDCAPRPGARGAAPHSAAARRASRAAARRHKPGRAVSADRARERARDPLAEAERDVWRQIWREAERGARRAGAAWLVIDTPAGEIVRLRGLSQVLDHVDFVLTPLGPSVFEEHATRAFVSLLENAPAVRRGDAELQVIANRVRAKQGRRAQALRRVFARLDPPPAAELNDGAAYPLLAAAGLGLFDPSAVTVGARRTQRLRENWRPILASLGVMTAARPAR